MTPQQEEGGGKPQRRGSGFALVDGQPIFDPATGKDKPCPLCGGSGNPETHSWSEQAVRAIRWAHIAGSSQWSTSVYCGGV